VDEGSDGADGADWTAGYDRRSFEFGGGTISWLELTGSTDSPETPIVLVHGLMGSALEHCEVGRLLGDRGPVYLLDLRSHGRSSAAPGNPVDGSIADQVGVVVGFVKEIVGRPVILVGNSFGAMICANVAAAAPELVRRLVLIGPAMRPANRLVDPVRFLQWLIIKPRWTRDRFDADVRAGKRPETPDAGIATATPYLDLVPVSHLEALRAEPAPAWSVENPPGRASVWRSRHDALIYLSRPRRCKRLLRSLTPPALWLHGADDPLMPAATAAEIETLLPGWKAETVAATGHVPHLERAGWTAERIGAWLDSPTR
jgi:pimeloyl-ACP methyl ester carboxylesterase